VGFALVGAYSDAGVQRVVTIHKNTGVMTPAGQLGDLQAWYADLTLDVGAVHARAFGKQGTNPRKLYTLDLATQLSTSVTAADQGGFYVVGVRSDDDLVVVYDQGAGVFEVGVVDATTTLYAALGTLDVATYQPTGTAFDTGRDVLYALGRTAGDSLPKLASFDLQTGEARAIYVPSVDYSGLVVGADGGLFTLEGTNPGWRAVRLDPMTGVASPIATLDMLGLVGRLVYERGTDRLYCFGVDFDHDPRLYRVMVGAGTSDSVAVARTVTLAATAGGCFGDCARPDPGELDPCALGTAACSPLAVCDYTGGVATCACDIGYAGDGTSCVPDGVCGPEVDDPLNCNDLCDDPAEDGTPDCDGVCANGEGLPDCDGVCGAGEAGTADCDGVCEVGEDGSSDCDGRCEDGEDGSSDCDAICSSDEGGSVDCDGVCEVGDEAPDCDGTCDVEAEGGSSDCDGECAAGEGATSDCDGVCALGEQGSSDCNGVCEDGEGGTTDCDGSCDPGDEDTPDCDDVCGAGEGGSADCDGICGASDAHPGPDCDGVCDSADEAGSSDCNGTCADGEAGTPDCDGHCGPGEGSTGDCDTWCNAGDLLPSPDCDGTCLGPEAGSPDCDGVCDGYEESTSPDCDGVCQPGERDHPDCDYDCDAGEEGSQDCDGRCDPPQENPDTSPDCSVPPCTVDVGCELEQLCYRQLCQSAPIGDAAVGDPCHENSDCESRLCRGNFCTARCEGAADCEAGEVCVEEIGTQYCKAGVTCGDCGVDGVCAQYSTGFGSCPDMCATNADCPSGQRCEADRDYTPHPFSPLPMYRLCKDGPYAPCGDDEFVVIDSNNTYRCADGSGCYSDATCADPYPTCIKDNGEDVGFCTTDAHTPPPPELAVVRVFVTSTKTSGNMGGVSGADSICAARAAAGGLDGQWLAWVSAGAEPPAARFPHLDVPYERLDGVKIADNWDDLVDGTLDAPISVNELGGTSVDVIWTNTATDGTRADASNTCNGFTSSNGGISTFYGLNNQTNNRWTQDTRQGCNYTAPIYCFEH